MNQHDRDNLEFLLAISPSILCEWFHQQSSDDIQYAIELLKKYEEILDDIGHGIVESKLICSRFNEANDIIKKFKRKI